MCTQRHSLHGKDYNLICAGRSVAEPQIKIQVKLSFQDFFKSGLHPIGQVREVPGNFWHFAFRHRWPFGNNPLKAVSLLDSKKDERSIQSDWPGRLIPVSFVQPSLLTPSTRARGSTLHSPLHFKQRQEECFYFQRPKLLFVLKMQERAPLPVLQSLEKKGSEHSVGVCELERCEKKLILLNIKVDNDVTVRIVFLRL